MSYYFSHHCQTEMEISIWHSYRIQLLELRKYCVAIITEVTNHKRGEGFLSPPVILDGCSWKYVTTTLWAWGCRSMGHLLITTPRIYGVSTKLRANLKLYGFSMA